MANTALQNLSKALINGEYKALAKIATLDLTTNEAKKENLKLFATDCMCSKFAYGMDMYEFGYKLESKSATGMNTVVSSVSAVDSVVKSLKKGAKLQGIIDYLKSDDCKIDNKEILIGSLEAANGVVDKKTSVLIPLFAAIVNAKIEAIGDPTKIKDINELEKSVEPLVISLINNGKVSLDLTTGEIKKQVISLLSTINEENGNKAKNFFHDITVSALLNTNVNRLDFLNVGIDKGSKNPMLKVSNEGTTRTFFDHHFSDTNKNTRFLPALKGSKFSDLLTCNHEDEDGYKNKLYTAFKLLQERVGFGELDENGVIKSRVAAPEKIARILVETAMLCGVLGVEVDNDFAFAIANPLIDIIDFVELETFNKIVKDAKADVVEIYKTEKPGEALPEILQEKVTTETEKPSPKTEKPKPKNEKPSPETKRKPKTVKLSDSNQKFRQAAIEEFSKLAAEILNSDTKTYADVLDLASPTVKIDNGVKLATITNNTTLLESFDIKKITKYYTVATKGLIEISALTTDRKRGVEELGAKKGGEIFNKLIKDLEPKDETEVE